MVTSGLTGVGTPIDASGAVLQQSPAQVATMYTRLVAHGVTATRVYDAVGSGAAILATANTYGMMGARPGGLRCGAARSRRSTVGLLRAVR
jgi:hypothetical protein